MAEKICPQFGGQNEFMKLSPFLLKLDDFENSLRILIAPTKLGKIGEGIDKKLPEKTKQALAETRPVFADEDTIYEISFEKYLMYQVTNEFFAKSDDYDIARGRLFKIYERSRFLDYFETATTGLNSSWERGGWKHYEICTEFQIIGVISDHTPIIKTIHFKKENKNEASN